MFCHLKNTKSASRAFAKLPVACIIITGWMTVQNLAAQDAPAPASVDASTADAPREITQAEIIKRQELVFSATQSIADGEKAEADGDLATALAKYEFAVDNLAPSEKTTAAIQKARAGVVRVCVKQYDLARKAADNAGAVTALETAAKYDPDNQAIKARLAKIKSTQQKPGKGDVVGNPAVTSQFVDDVHTVDDLLVQAEQFRRTGQFDEAEARYNKALSIDKYNEKAMKGLKRVAEEKEAYYRETQFATRDERMRQVDEKWAVKPKRETAISPVSGGATPFTMSNQFAINQKLKSMIIKDLSFTDATIEDAANALAARSKELDPDPAKLGISFIVKPEAASSAKTFSLNLRNIPMEDALRYITQLANVKPKVEEYAVVIVPIRESIEVLLRRTFNVAPSFFPPPATAPTGVGGAGGGRRPPPVVAVTDASSGGTNDVKALLEDRGVDFKTPGSSAVYYPGSGVLQVVNTQEQIDLIEELVNAGQTPTYMVDVTTRLVEIAQTDINELTFNAAINVPGITGSNIPGTTGAVAPILNPVTGVVEGKVSAATALRGSQGFNAGNLDSLLGIGGIPKPATFTLQGHIADNVFNLVMAALAEKKSFDLLSAPSLRVKNGEDATINVSRTFFYATAFDPAESAAVQTVSQGTGISVGPPVVIPIFPTEFESRDIGVKMKVRPQLGADNKTIDLALFPEVTDFQGFINYGSPIFVVGGSSGRGINGTNAYLLSNNVLNQPVFNTRRIDTKVFVKDGYTVVLGGLMRDDVQTITDKVPFFGDLPLVGRLFQSKATQNQKKNLLIFVTCRIYLNNGELLNPPAPIIPAGAGVPTASR